MYTTAAAQLHQERPGHEESCAFRNPPSGRGPPAPCREARARSGSSRSDPRRNFESQPPGRAGSGACAPRPQRPRAVRRARTRPSAARVILCPQRPRRPPGRAARTRLVTRRALRRPHRFWCFPARPCSQNARALFSARSAAQRIAKLGRPYVCSYKLEIFLQNLDTVTKKVVSFSSAQWCYPSLRVLCVPCSVLVAWSRSFVQGRSRQRGEPTLDPRSFFFAKGGHHLRTGTSL